MKKPPRLSLDAQLEAVPVFNAAAKVEFRDDGSALASVPLRFPRGLRWAAERLGWGRSMRNYAIDAIGAGVLARIDGERSIGEIVESFGAENQLAFFEARGLILQYLHLLIARGVVGVMLKSRTPPAESPPA